jgi:hypothetical protein
MACFNTNMNMQLQIKLLVRLDERGLFPTEAAMFLKIAFWDIVPCS